jgi:DNA-binding MarR family transcriptional regulator
MERKQLEQFIFGSIFLLSNKLQLSGDCMLEEITVKQWFLLLLMTKMPTASPSITEIANFSITSRQNTKKMLDVLEKKGFVEITPQESDRRNLSVTMTPKVQQYFNQFEATGNNYLDVLFSGIPDDNLASVQETFHAMFNNLTRIGEKHETDI